MAEIKNYLAKFLRADFILANAFVPLVVLSVYFMLFALVLPVGINKVFAARLWKYSLAMVIIAAVGFLALRRREDNPRYRANRSEGITQSDFFLFLLPMMPIVQYIVRNRDILRPAQMLLVLAIFLSFSLLVSFLIPKALGRFGSERTLMLTGITFSFAIFNMANLTHQFSWFEQGSLKVQVPVLAGVFLFSWFAYDLGYQRLFSLVIAAFFISNIGVQLSVPNELDESVSESETVGNPDYLSGNKLVDLVGERRPGSTPNIYLLLYDAYAHNETMLSYGINNSAQEDYLTDLGFTLYPHTYSVTASTMPTMTRVLNVSAEFDGTRTAIAGGGVVHHLLSSFGYRTYGVFRSDGFFQGIEPNYDYSFPEPGSPALLLSEAIWMGEFRFDTGYNRVSFEDYLAAKRWVFMEDSAEPRFLYSHSDLPGHSHNAGFCNPDEEVQMYATRLQRANRQMRDDLEILLRNDPEAIVIIAGDHGPQLTKNCYVTAQGGYEISEITRQDIQDRFGTFLAIRWPTSGYEEFDDIRVLQDLFPAIFAYLFDDPRLLEVRIEPATLEPSWVSGARVVDGIIEGGAHDRERLFVGD